MEMTPSIRELAEKLANDLSVHQVQDIARIEQALDEALEEERKLRADWGYRIECLEKQLEETRSENAIRTLMEEK